MHNTVDVEKKKNDEHALDWAAARLWRWRALLLCQLLLRLSHTHRPKSHHWRYSSTWRMGHQRHASRDYDKLAQCSFCSVVNRWRTNLVATHHMFNSDVRIACTDLYNIPTTSAVSLIVLWWFSYASWLIFSTFPRVTLMVDLPDCLSSRNVLLLKWLCHSKHWLIVVSMLSISVADFPSWKQNFMYLYSNFLIMMKSQVTVYIFHNFQREHSNSTRHIRSLLSLTACPMVCCHLLAC